MLRRRQQTKWLLTSALTGTLALTASSLRRSISTSVKKVTRSNFEATLEKLQVDVRESDFVAIDLEMSGVASAPWRESFVFDDFEVQYLKLKDSADKFGVMQFGVCPFRWDRTKFSFVANPHNFYTFPRKELPIDGPSCEFLCQTSSIDFLAKHQFDFNAYVNDGISYLSKDQETEALHTLSLAFEKKSNVSLDDSVEPVEIPLVSTADIFFTERMKNRFIEWRNGILKGSLADGNTIDSRPQFETIFFKRRPAILLDGFNSHQYNLIQKVIKKYFRDLVYVHKVHDDNLFQRSVVVYSTSDGDKASLMKEVNEDLWNTTKEKIKHAVGFRHVIDLLASEKKLIVGHSCILDVAHIFSKFIRPLPSTMTEFASSLHECFPNIIDTKHLLKGNDAIQRLMDKKRKSLSSVFSLLCPELSSASSSSHSSPCIQHVKIEVPADGTGPPWNSGAKHEAGYDAFMTGCVFAQECSYLGIDFKHHMASLELSKNEKLQKHINLLYPNWKTEVVLDLKTGTAEVPISGEQYNKDSDKANIILLWGFPSKIKPAELKECISKALGADSVMSIFFIDESAALVQFKHQDSASKFVVLKDSLERKNNVVSVLHPLSVLLEGGNTRAADYATYKEICGSSASKVLFADQAETLDIRWTTKLISSNAETKKDPTCSSQVETGSDTYLEDRQYIKSSNRSGNETNRETTKAAAGSKIPRTKPNGMVEHTDAVKFKFP